jgi:hypothetical protein
MMRPQDSIANGRLNDVTNRGESSGNGLRHPQKD